MTGAAATGPTPSDRLAYRTPLAFKYSYSWDMFSGLLTWRGAMISRAPACFFRTSSQPSTTADSSSIALTDPATMIGTPAAESEANKPVRSDDRAPIARWASNRRSPVTTTRSAGTPTASSHDRKISFCVYQYLTASVCIEPYNRCSILSSLDVARYGNVVALTTTMGVPWRKHAAGSDRSNQMGKCRCRQGPSAIARTR